MTTTYLDRMAGFASTLAYADLPAPVVLRAHWLLLDGIAVMLAGAREPRIGALARLLQKRGSSGRSVFTTDGTRGDAADAALVNATAACAHVLDEGHKYARGHVGTYVMPAVLAVAEERAVSCTELVTALVVSS